MPAPSISTLERLQPCSRLRWPRGSRRLLRARAMLLHGLVAPKVVPERAEHPVRVPQLAQTDGALALEQAAPLELQVQVLLEHPLIRAGGLHLLETNGLVPLRAAHLSEIQADLQPGLLALEGEGREVLLHVLPLRIGRR